MFPIEGTHVAGIMGKYKDLSKFDEGQLMARQLAQTISKIAELVGHSSDRIMDGQGSLMQVESEGQPVWFDTDQLLYLRSMKKLMLALMERCHIIQCITILCTD